MKLPQPMVKPALWFVLSIISAASMDFYVTKIWNADRSSGFSDLYAPWWGAHELFLRGRNPYSPAAAHEIQTVIYGAPVAAQQGDDSPERAGGFAYPLYAAFLLWPSVHMAFPVLQTLFAYVSIVVTLVSLVLWLSRLHFRGPPIAWLTFAIFTLGTFPVLQGIRLQNLSLIAAGLLALTVALLTGERLTLAGVLLAASTFKPQFTVVLVPWLAVWAVSDWRRRRPLVWSFLASMLLLIGTAEWLLPGWIGDFLRVVRAYRQYTFGHSLLDVWFTSGAGPFVAAGLLLVVGALCWPCRRQGTSTPGFLLVISLMLAATLTVIPTLAPHTQLLLLPGFLCLHRHRSVLAGAERFGRLLFAAVWLLLAWPWVAAAGLTLAAALLPVRALLPWWNLPLYTSPLLPLAVLLALGWLVRTRTCSTDHDLDPLPR
jgi:hypothetical protein